MYEEYVAMKGAGEKYAYIMAVLTHKYRLSECSIWRIVRRIRKDINI